MKAYLPDFQIEKLLLDSAMDSYPVYHYCRKNGIVPFIDLKKTNNGNYKYKDSFTIDPDGVPRCKKGLRMHHDGIEYKKNRCKFRCPLSNRQKGCFYDEPCSDAKYGRTVHTYSLAFLTYRQETVRNGKRNMTEELLWNVLINVRKMIIC